MNQIQPTVFMTEPPDIPEAYKETIVSFLRQYWKGRKREMQESFGFHNLPILTDDQLLKAPLAATLAEIARVAAGEVQRTEQGFVEGAIYVGIQGLMEDLFAPRGLGLAYTIPASFWNTPLGQMVARAWLWLQGDELITLKEAADIRGVSVPAISRAVQNRRLTRYVNPDAPKRQGRTLVSRAEVEGMDQERKEEKEMASSYVFGCKLGLSQSGCQKREYDPNSRGAAQRIGGCASCKHREPHNQKTAKAEAAHKG